MTTQAPNDKVRAAAQLDAEICARRIGRLRKRQAMPHLVAAALLSAGVGAHLIAFLTQWQALVTAAIILLGVATVATAVHLRDKLPAAWRNRIIGSAVGGATWLTCASLGMSPTLVALLMIGELGVASRWWRTNRDEATQTPAPVASSASPVVVTEPPAAKELARWRKYISVQNGIHPNSDLVYVSSGPHTKEFVVDLIPGGQTLTTAIGNLERLASGLGLKSVTDLVLDRPPTLSLSQYRLQIVTHNPIKGKVLFDGPRFHDGIIDLGPFVDGRGEAPYRLYTDGSMWSGLLIGGTGIGKSPTAINIALNAMSDLDPRTGQPQTVVWYIDPQNGVSSPTLKKHADWFVNLGGARDMLAALKAIGYWRGVQSAANEWPGFQRSGDRPGILVIIDECHKVFENMADAEEWAVIAREFRKLGIALFLMDQYPGLQTFGGCDPLRSSVMEGNILAMHTKSQSGGGLLPGLPVHPISLPKIPGYGILSTAGVVADEDEGLRAAAWRNRLVEDPDAWFESLQRRGLDAYASNALDTLGLTAYANRNTDPTTALVADTRIVDRIVNGTATFDELMAYQQTTVAANPAASAATGTAGTAQDGGLGFPQLVGLGSTTAPAPVGPMLTEPEQRYLSILDTAVCTTGTVPGMRDIERLSGWAETTARGHRDSLVDKGVLTKLKYGRYGRPGTPVTAEGDDEEPELVNAEHATA